MRQLFSAVGYLHSHEIIHRDIKPENIFFDNKIDYDIKLCDLNTAVNGANKRNQSDLVGTPYYIAPEVLYGSYDIQSDIWSLGVIMYLLLIGKPPFDGRNDKEVVKKVIKGQWD